jgi:radical SAM superfamily enzyme YgiQ (UPF0313 family)
MDWEPWIDFVVRGEGEEMVVRLVTALEQKRVLEEVPGIGKMDPKLKSIGGEHYWKNLVALADSKAPTETRVMAVRALGLVRESLLEKPIE